MEKEIIKLNNNSFKELIESGKTVLVDFFATWCGPCKMLAPILEDINKELPDEVQIAKIDIDESFDTARSYGVLSIPTLIMFKKGQEVDKIVGLRNKDAILEFIDENK